MPTLVRILILFLTSGSLAVHAQRVLRGRELQRARELFQVTPVKTFRCHVTWNTPYLDFGFRFVLPIHAEFRADQFSGTGRRLLAAIRVTADGHEPAYVGYRLFLPKHIPESTKVNLAVDSAVVTGPGPYRVELILQAGDGRACQSSTRKVAKVPRGVLEQSLLLPPGTVSAITAPPWHSLPSGTKAEGKQLTVLIHAQPPSLRAGGLTSYDRYNLLGSLSSLIRKSGFARFRVVAFNLDQQTEIYRADDFNGDDFEDLADALEAVQLGTVSYSVLRDPIGDEKLLAKVVRGEWESGDPSDAVLILGWPSRKLQKMPLEHLAPVPARRPRLYYFDFRAWRNVRGEFADMMEHMVKDLGGKVRTVHDARELASAIQWLAETETRTLPSIPAGIKAAPVADGSNGAS